MSASPISPERGHRVRHLRVAVAALLVFLVLACVVFGWLHRPSAQPALKRELTREELDTHGGLLYPRGGTAPYDGLLVERYHPGVLKAATEIRHGKADGVSRGWYETGQTEVEERIHDNVAEGLRRRWHPNGQLRSEAQVEHGEIEGNYREWHDNGQLAVEMTLHAGKPEGWLKTWYPSGANKTQVRMAYGEPVEQHYFPEATAGATAEISPNPEPADH